MATANTLLINLNAKVNRDYQNNIWNFELDGNLGEQETENSEGKDETETTQKNIKFDSSYKRLMKKQFISWDY